VVNLSRDVLMIKCEIEKLKDLLHKMLESPDQDKNKILEVSHKLDHYILKYYKNITIDNIND
jgi:hypothetical protein